MSNILFRQFRLHKGLSLLIVGGLAVGIACSTLIFLYVEHEWSYDRSHNQGDRIHRVIVEMTSQGRVSLNDATPPPLAPLLSEDLPEVARATRLLRFDNPVPLVRYGDKTFYEDQFLFADQSTFDTFTIPFVQGDPSRALQGPNGVVITEGAAKKYFGAEAALGKTLTVNNTVQLVVRGVVRQPPSNSTVQFDILASFPTLEVWLGKEFLESWQNNTCQTYLLLKDGADVRTLTQRISGMTAAHLARDGNAPRIILQPLFRMHLYAFKDYGMAAEVDIDDIYLLVAIGIVVLLIAAVNFLNLTTVRMTIRAREVAMRKILGATQSDLVRQFIGEAAFVTVASLAIAALLVELFFPLINTFTGKDLARFTSQHWLAWVAPVGLGIFVGLSAGTYPALLLSALNPAQGLKGFLDRQRFRGTLRKALVVLQFTLSIVLLVGTLVIRKQLDFLDKKELGFSKDNVLVIPIRDEALRKNCEPLKEQLRHQAGVLATTAAALLPGGPVGKTQVLAEGRHDPGTMSLLWVDLDFVKTLSITLVAGRDFSKAFPTDMSAAFILNEQAVRQLGWRSPADAIGKSIELAGGKKGSIIGVAKDFNVTSLRRTIDPLVMHLWPWLNYMLVRVDEGAYPEAVESLKAIWQRFDPDHPFTYTFLNERFDRFLQPDRRLSRVFSTFAILSVLIACSGLFSIIALTTQQRTKEVGIRKVLGASVQDIWGLLTRETVSLVLFANIVAWPVAYLVMKTWLHNFAYPIDLDIGMFLFSGGITIVMALMAVGYHSAKASAANPIKALRYE